MTTLVDRDDPSIVFEPLELIAKIELRAGKAMDNHEWFTATDVVIGSLDVAVGDEIGRMHADFFTDR